MTFTDAERDNLNLAAGNPLIVRPLVALRDRSGKDYLVQSHAPNKTRRVHTYTLFERVNGHVFACMPPHRIADLVEVIETTN